MTTTNCVHLTLQIYHVLPSWRRVKIVVVDAAGFSRHLTGGLGQLGHEADLDLADLVAARMKMKDKAIEVDIDAI